VNRKPDRSEIDTSTSGIPVFDHTIQETNLWLKAVAEQLSSIVMAVTFYEGWHMTGKPTKDRHVEDFVDHILKELAPQSPVDPFTMARGVFETLWEGVIRASSQQSWTPTGPSQTPALRSTTQPT